MPNNIGQANYRLRLEGKLPTGEMAFSDEKKLIFQQKAVSILVQTDKPDYRHENWSKNLIKNIFVIVILKLNCNI